MRILGIDPGSRATGYAVILEQAGRLHQIAAGVIRCGGGELAQRLARLDREMARIIEETRPDVAALESVFVARNPRAALLLGHARGVALAACGRAGLLAAEYAPTRVKLAVVGSGRADKRQVQFMVRQLLGLSRAPPEDAADALAVAVCHAHGVPPAEAVEPPGPPAGRSRVHRMARPPARPT